jgi:hypothetical protein
LLALKVFDQTLLRNCVGAVNSADVVCSDALAYTYVLGHRYKQLAQTFFQDVRWYRAGTKYQEQFRPRLANFARVAEHNVNQIESMNTILRIDRSPFLHERGEYVELVILSLLSALGVTAQRLRELRRRLGRILSRKGSKAGCDRTKDGYQKGQIFTHLCLSI